MRPRDPDHWLFRLTPEEWLAAANNELARAEEALEGRRYRAGVTQSLRAAGMAWNAVLAAADDETGYGRSYRDQFAGLFPNANYMISHNLLTQTATPDHAALVSRDAASLQVVREWLADPRFATIRSQLEKARGRLEEFMRQAGR